MHKTFSDESIDTRKIAMLIEYRGALYHGWQKQLQPDVPTVQATLEQAIKQVAAHDVQIFCAGRTDAKVHGTAQVIHFETSALRSQKAWVCGVNAQLPDDVRVRWAGGVDDAFHARFSATARTYRYLIINTPVKPAIFAHLMTWHERPLAADKMHQAAQALLGENDFSAFQAAACQSHSSFRCVEYINVRRSHDVLVIEIKANAFLLHMVRNIAAVLMEIGDGRKPVEWAQQVLQSRDRQQASVTAKPDGLYLVAVDYPDSFAIPQLSKGPSLLESLFD